MAEDNQGGTPENNGGTPATGAQDAPPTFDSWLSGQDDQVKALIDGHVTGLKTALNSERDQRKQLAKELKDLTGTLDKDSDARKAAEELSGKLETYEQQLGAYETLQSAGARNLKLAWIAAREAGAIRKDGTVSLELLKSEYPELFKTQTPPPGNAGAGAGGNQPPPGGKGGMDTLIRQKAGVSTER